MTKKLYIKTYGCQMNVYDTGRMRDVLAPLGFAATETPDDADMVILNTCHIREKAEDKVFSDLGRIHKMQRKRKDGKHMLVAVGGCVAQAQGEEIIKRAPYVNMVFGPQSYHHLPEMVTKALRGAGGQVELEFPAVQKFDFLPEETASTGASAFLAVQEGCDKFCTFCVVPYTRGAEYSRPAADIEKEARRLVDQGVVDITLLGQNVNAYHGAAPDGGEWNFAKLIERLSKIKGLERIRYTTSHPRDMDDELIAAHRDIEQLMPYLHLPIQSGSDRVLKMMNRKHTAEFYLNILEKLRAARPDIALSSDFIVGFPGETDADFNDTLRLIETVGYAQAYSFKYSPRPGTPAATEEIQVAEEVKEARLAELQNLLFTQQIAFNRSMVGKTLPVLFDRDGKHEGQLIGKSPYLQSVYVNDSSLRDQIVPVRITAAHQNSLAGEVVSDFRSAA